jgi:UDP-N-acetylglucosamine 2-epimerase (non-hydrolysing)
VREVVAPILAGHPRVLLAEPPRFDEFINLAARVDLILSDSGGIQEEATQLKRFVVVLREETERPEAVDAGFARLCPPVADVIRGQVAELLPRAVAGTLVPDAPSPFGDGHAAARITEALNRYFDNPCRRSRTAE